MPGRRCAVFGCNNSRIRTKVTNSEIVYHNFPKGKSNFVSDTVRKEWIRRCKRADKWNPDTSQICSVHFTANDYERDMRNELLGKK
jgi:DNA/RNA endonuclease G (NUC1)